MSAWLAARRRRFTLALRMVGCLPALLLASSTLSVPCAAAANAGVPAPAVGRNLKVLPRDIPAGELAGLMARYSRELGVQCQFCHTENSQGIDFASDESPQKQTARIMIAMLSDINTKYLGQVRDQRYSVPLTCGNCHQGLTTPPVYEARP